MPFYFIHLPWGDSWWFQLEQKRNLEEFDSYFPLVRNRAFHCLRGKLMIKNISKIKIISFDTAQSILCISMTRTWIEHATFWFFFCIFIVCDLIKMWSRIRRATTQGLEYLKIRLKRARVLKKLLKRRLGANFCT